MGLKYIYTGYHKCGTKTVARAFQILGFKVYDFEENLIYLAKSWKQFFDESTTTKEKYQILYNMYKDVDVVCEGPNLYFWRELLEVFPEAKVIHYQRPIDSWYKSYAKQNYEIRVNYKYLPNWFIEYSVSLFLPSLRNYRDVQKYLCCMMAGQPAVTWLSPWTNPVEIQNEIGLKRSYRLHNADVLNSCPKDKLLVLDSLNVSWEEFCKFTRTKIPSEPWPHENKDGLGLIERRGYSAQVLYNPFVVPENLMMATLKREATTRAILMLVFLVAAFLFFRAYDLVDFLPN